MSVRIVFHSIVAISYSIFMIFIVYSQLDIQPCGPEEGHGSRRSGHTPQHPAGAAAINCLWNVL